MFMGQHLYHYLVFWSKFARKNIMDYLGEKTDLKEVSSSFKVYPLWGEKPNYEIMIQYPRYSEIIRGFFEINCDRLFCGVPSIIIYVKKNDTNIWKSFKYKKNITIKRETIDTIQSDIIQNTECILKDIYDVV